jgi:hypothetical protein
MKKLKITKVIVSSLIVISLLVLKPIGVNAQWKEDNTGWWYSDYISYSTGWKTIDENLYYFYPDDYQKGYMAHDTIVDGFYLNSDGVFTATNGEKEIYINLLTNKDWLTEHTDFEQGGQVKNIILDINQDGISEMLLYWGEYSGGLGGKTISIVTCNNGKINVEDINTSHGGYYGYSSSEKVFFVSGGQGGNSYIKGYKLDDNYCKEVYSCEDNAGEVGKENATYILNGQEVSEAEYSESFEKFGEINKNIAL